MNTKTTIIIVSIIAIVTALIVILFKYILMFSFVGSTTEEKENSNTIIEVFENNKTLFEEVLEELSNYEEIHIDEAGSIYTFVNENNKNSKVELNQDDFEKTLQLMKKCKLKKITKDYGNVRFLFKSTMRWGQYIIKMTHEEKFKWEYHIINKKKISENWYYIEAE
ncbi:MAG: hypothetical protein PHR25_01260 [Clostridia bacterium]|nr:hypothetical protein [Clostridia bacterium]MDD4375395.1 hypothetical protein [Clostridia bacterium]